VARVGQGKMEKGYARISLLSSSRDNLDLVTGIGHQAGMVSQDAFDSSNNGRGRVVEQSNFCH